MGVILVAFDSEAEVGVISIGHWYDEDVGGCWCGPCHGPHDAGDDDDAPRGEYMPGAERVPPWFPNVTMSYARTFPGELPCWFFWPNFEIYSTG